MKLGKVLLGILSLVVVAVLYFIFMGPRGSNPIQRAGENSFLGEQSKFHGDDPTYAEELRKNSALTQETQRRQQSIENTLSAIGQQREQDKRQLENQLDEVKKLLQQNAERTKNVAGEAAETIQKEMDTKLSNALQGIKTLQQQLNESETKYHELEQKLAEQQASPPVVIAENKNEQEQEETKKQALPNAYGTGSMILPYQSPYHALSPSHIERDTNNSDSAGGDIINGVGAQLNAVTTALNGTSLKNVNENPRLLPIVQQQHQGEWPTVFPVYTVPPNTTLTNALLVTPIIGRVPLNRENDLQDPFFFRVEIGGKNLAANGHQIPGVAKMIASGYAVGQREQQCVRGYIDSLTFIFIDGRIVTQGKNATEGSSNSDALGYLSDPWGKPCIHGRYINNAGSYLKSRGAAAFIEAAAEALSQGEVSYRQDNNGNLTAVLDGNVWRYVFGKGVSGTASEFADYVRERTSNAFDVVYVEQGKPVQIMIDKMINIDYDANARKVNYYREPKQRKHVYD
ncbi:MAG: TIGR03752 family integrating conjugative element protein [Cardiobacteriaceae bacterium]|nr:TIGR03752 family integrating conjugative element protein [Cardiobacteriaceae bacterium]